MPLQLDYENDRRDKFPDIESDNVNLIIKRNLRRESPLVWFDLGKCCGEKIPSCEGKEVWVGQTLTGINGQPLPYLIVFQGNVSKHYQKGPKLAFPEIDVETYWCSLAQMPALEVIDLYHDHGLLGSMVIIIIQSVVSVKNQKMCSNKSKTHNIPTFQRKTIFEIGANF